MAHVARWLDRSFFVLYALLSFEIVLELLGASDAAPFHRFTEWATAPFFAPFAELLHDPVAGHHRLMFSYLMALIAYSVVHIAAQGLLESMSPKRNATGWRPGAR